MWAKSRRSAMSASTTQHGSQPLEYQLSSICIRVLFMDLTSSLPNPGQVAEHGISGGVLSPGLWDASLPTLQPLNSPLHLDSASSCQRKGLAHGFGYGLILKREFY